MTDIYDLVHQQDATFELEIMGRKDGIEVPTGVIFTIRGLDNPDSENEVAAVRRRMLGERIMKNKEYEPDLEKVGQFFGMSTGDPTDKQLAHCVTAWNWNGKTLGKVKTDYSVDNVMAVFKAAPWIKKQVLDKVIAIGDFTMA